VLRFQLEYNQECRTSFRIKNISDGDVLYKVKTTLPSTYYVNPNQDCLQKGEEIVVTVIMMNEDCINFIQAHNVRGVAESVDRHRFKIEAVAISPTQYNNLKKAASAVRSAEYNTALELAEAKHTAKFKVQYTYPPREEAAAASAGRSLSADQGSSVSPTKSRGGGTIAFDDQNTAHDPNSIDSVLSELQALRTRYDKVLELTVNLTAEKDTMLARLEAKQNERKEKSKMLERERKGAKAMAGAQKKQGLFSWNFIIFAAIVAFALGFYLDRKAFLDAVSGTSSKAGEL